MAVKKVLTDLEVTGNVDPGTNDTYNLGSPTCRWIGINCQDLYTQWLDFGYTGINYICVNDNDDGYDFYALDEVVFSVDSSGAKVLGQPIALKSEIPTTLPASDVYAWAKASTKPSYNYGEIGAGIATGAILDVHPESNSSLIAYYTNDLVNLVARGGSISATNKTRGTSIDVSGTVNGTPSYSQFTVTAVTDVVEILISSPAYSWNTNFGIGFGSSNWRAKNVKIEVGYEADGTTDWVTVLDVKNSGNQIHNVKASGPNVRTSTYTWNKLRYTLTNFNNTSPRIAGIWTQNYGSKGLAYNFLQTSGGTMYGSIESQQILPRVNNSYLLGSNSKQWYAIYGTTIYQNGKQVANKEDIPDISGKLDKAGGEITGNAGLIVSGGSDLGTKPTKNGIYLGVESNKNAHIEISSFGGSASYIDFVTSENTDYTVRIIKWADKSTIADRNKFQIMNGSYKYTFPEKTGTIALTSDIPGVATTSANGLMSSTDKTRLDDLYTNVGIISLEDNNTTTAGTWLAKTNKISSYVDGQLFLYKITVAGASTTTLNITGSGGTALGAKNVYYNSTTKFTTHFPVGRYILLCYNTTITVSMQLICTMLIIMLMLDNIKSTQKQQTTQLIFILF